MSVIVAGIQKHEDCYNCKFHTNYRTNDYGSFCECMLDDECNKINLLEHKILNFCPLKSINELIEFIKNHSYPICYDRNSTELGMTITGIEQAIKEYCKEQ